MEALLSMSIGPTILTPGQCRAARALIELPIEQLSQASNVRQQTIIDFEAEILDPDPETKRRIRVVLEAAGVAFIPENGGGVGVRLKFSRREVRAIYRWESEGGTPGEDVL